MRPLIRITRCVDGSGDPRAERYILQAARNGSFLAEILYIEKGRDAGYVVGAWQERGSRDEKYVEFGSVGDRYIEHCERLARFTELMRHGQALAEIMRYADDPEPSQPPDTDAQA